MGGGRGSAVREEDVSGVPHARVVNGSWFFSAARSTTAGSVRELNQTPRTTIPAEKRVQSVLETETLKTQKLTSFCASRCSG
jgi:hypothetical protein